MRACLPRASAVGPVLEQVLHDVVPVLVAQQALAVFDDSLRGVKIKIDEERKCRMCLKLAHHAFNTSVLAG